MTGETLKSAAKVTWYEAMRTLYRWEKVLLAGFFLVLLPALGALVEYRSAFLSRRMGDLDCFLRAGWAVRTGNDLYAVTSDNDWHYNYPPFLAILAVPLADPPRGEDSAGYLPYGWSVAICYLLNVLCLFASAHVLASALEERMADNGGTLPRFCARWWALRSWPVLVCFLPIGHTMVRGQVNILILATLCAAGAAWLRGQSFRAGVWVALAMCIKIIPVYLLVYPLWKRDWRALGGVAAGLLVAGALIPTAAFGPEKTVEHYATYSRVMFGPLFGYSEDETRKHELLGVNSSDSVGFKNVIHNWTYPVAHERPEHMHPIGKAMYLGLGFLMTFVTLWPGTWPGRRSASLEAIQFASLILLMTLFSPVCHSHYLLLCMPIVMVLCAEHWRHERTLKLPGYVVVSGVAFFTTMAIAYLPGCEILKDRCASLFATVPLWAIAVVWMWRSDKVSTATATHSPRETLRHAA